MTRVSQAERLPASRPSRRRRPGRHDVVNMPPPWKRSLTESGMTRKATRADVVIVVVFAVLLVAVLVWIVGALLGAPH